MRRLWAEDCATSTTSLGLGYWAKLNEFEKINTMKKKKSFQLSFHMYKNIF